VSEACSKKCMKKQKQFCKIFGIIDI